VTRGGRTVARLPYVVAGRGGARALTQPPSTATLGPWIEPTSRKTAKGLGLEMELLTELEAGLPPARAFAQRFGPAVLNALPFHWAGYRLEVRYTYRIETPGSGEDQWERLGDSARRGIEAARRCLEIRDDLGLGRFEAVLAAASGTADGGTRAPRRALLERIDAACASRGARWMLFACDAAERVHAAAYVVFDDHGAHCLAGGGPEPAADEARSLLLWEAVLRAGTVTGVLDVGDAPDPRAERRLHAFGARPAPLLQVSRGLPRAAAELLTGTRGRLGARGRRGARGG